MSAPMVKTKEPGIYRRGSRYVVRYRADGKHRTESARTLDEARRIKAKRRTELTEGEYRPPTRETFADYARAWIQTYQGKGKGFRERTRADYSRDLERYVIPFLGAKRITAIRRADIAALIAWLAADDAQAKRHEGENAARRIAGEKPLRAPGPLRDRTIARVLAVVSACFNSAMLDEVRRDNPASKAVLPKRDPLAMPDEHDEMGGEIKALTRAEIGAILAIVHPDWRVFFRLLAATGLRVSEAIALDVAHLQLNGSRPHVKVRRAYGRDGMDRPKSEHGVRDVPLPAALVQQLRAHIAALPALPVDVERKWGRLVFPSSVGTPVSPENLRRRVLRPATEEAGAAWAGFHAFRHTFASMHIERGTNIVRLSRLLGHHKASFTLDVYAHLLDDGLGDALDLDGELADGAATWEQSGNMHHATPLDAATPA
ncbi:MAG: tyrosine-type recombinase/integrase [Solirubrobacteraceae bacterium]